MFFAKKVRLEASSKALCISFVSHYTIGCLFIYFFLCIPAENIGKWCVFSTAHCCARDTWSFKAAERQINRYRKLGAKRDFQLTCVRWFKLFLKLIANKTKTCFHPYSVFNYCSVHFSFLESLRACNPAASRPHRSVPDKVTLASLDLTAVIGSEGWWSVCVWGSRCFSRVPCSTFKEQGDASVTLADPEITASAVHSQRRPAGFGLPLPRRGQEEDTSAHAQGKTPTNLNRHF